MDGEYLHAARAYLHRAKANTKVKSLSDVFVVGVSRGYTDYYQGRGHSIRPTAAVINIHEHLI